MKLKICGMNNSDNISEIAALLPDYIGFIFWKKSTRFFDGSIPNIPKSILKVGVFVDENSEEIITKIQKYKLDLVQLHGNENSVFCKKLKELNIKIIKAFCIDEEFDFDILNEYQTACDYFLFDTKGKLPGGNGTTFDWNLLKKYHLEKPFFISGGIDLEHVKNIKSFSKLNISKNCIAIDVNSKFEIKPGIKNTNKLSQFKKMLNENEL